MGACKMGCKSYVELRKTFSWNAIFNALPNNAFFSKKESKNGNYRCQHERNQLNLSKHFLGNFQTEHVCKIEGCATVFRNHFYGFQLHECNSQTNLYIMAHVIDL